MFGFFKKKDKAEVSLIPKVGDVLMFDSFDFKTLNDSTKFSLDSEGVKVVDIGNCKIMDLTYVNVYFEDIVSPDITGYIQMRLIGNDVEDCKLFISHDVVFPETSEDWTDWLGDADNKGIMCDECFIIEDDGVETQYDSVYNNFNPIEYIEEINGEYINNEFSVFVRDIKDDFIDTEYVSLIMSETDTEASISIYIGVGVKAETLGIK